MNKVRVATMNHMSHCWSTIPHVTQHDTVDISRLNDLRKNLGSRAEERGAKLTVTAMLVKIVSSALKVFPNFNASINTKTNEIQYKEFYNIGIAVDTDQGLIVPVIKDADHMSMIDLAVELTLISQKARAGEISLNELQGNFHYFKYWWYWWIVFYSNSEFSRGSYFRYWKRSKRCFRQNNDAFISFI